MTAVLITSHLVDSDAPAVDRDGRVVLVGRQYAWRGAHGSRSGRVVRVERHGVPVAVVVAQDTGAEVRVVSSALVALAEAAA